MSRRAERGPTAAPGQALVEFALVMPLLAILLFGLIDMARFVYSNNSVNEVAREAARQGTVARRPPVCDALGRVACIKALVHDRITAVSVTDADIHVVCYRVPSTNAQPLDTFTEANDNCGSEWQGGDLVKVRISSNFWLATPVLGQFLRPTIEGNATWVTVNG
jgi:Flp pilus assembly protein TadG